MTEVAGLLMPADHRLTTVRHYEAGPPEGLELVEPGETFATTKEEEWVSKKKTEVINTKQIETRVKRQVVLEDGKVVEDSGPQVTTNTTEDTETQEHHQTELRKLGDDENNEQDAIDGPNNNNNNNKTKDLVNNLSSSKWISVPNPDGVVREVKEKRVISREETEQVKETEDVQHFGDITDEDFLAAVKSGNKDIRHIIRHPQTAITSTGPRIIRDTTKSHKTIDTENKRESSSLLPDGKIITESERTTEHEIIKDEELPIDSQEIIEDYHKESQQRYLKTRDQEDVDYLADGIKIGHEMRFRTETMEVERTGGGGDEPDFDSLSARVRRQQQQQRRIETTAAAAAPPLDRKDALTRKPLDFDQEEETRKAETNKWLEHHFGSESRSSNNSIIEDDDDDHHETKQPPKTSFFNVTIKSNQPINRETTHQQQHESSYIKNVTTNITPPSNEYYKGISQWSERQQQQQQQKSPTPDYIIRSGSRMMEEPVPDYGIVPTPPLRKRATERRQIVEESRNRYVKQQQQQHPVEEPPPDYSPPDGRKVIQKTRFAPDPPKAKSGGNIIGQSIRKLVGKIRSASAERKAKQRAKRSPSPSYQKGHIIDNNIGSHHHHHNNNNNNIMENRQPPVQRYYLGEDPFAGSIYGRENKYDGVKPAVRNSRRQQHHLVREEEIPRSQSTLGRFSKSTSRLVNTSSSNERSSQTLPRHLSRHSHEPPTRDTINVSIINTVSSSSTNRNNTGPAKPARTYKSNLSRSKSLHAADDYRRIGMYTSNPQLNRLDENAEQLKSPRLISSLSRSQKDLLEQEQQQDVYNNTSRFVQQRNGIGGEINNTTSIDSKKRVFMKGLKDRAPELFHTLHENETTFNRTSTPVKKNINGDVYETPTRLRRGSGGSSTDYSETYHTTTRNDDPLRPSVTNTVKSFSKKTIPVKGGRGVETIESSETKSVTKSHYRDPGPGGIKYYESERRYSPSPVVIEVRNSSYRK